MLSLLVVVIVVVLVVAVVVTVVAVIVVVVVVVVVVAVVAHVSARFCLHLWLMSECLMTVTAASTHLAHYCYGHKPTNSCK